MAKTNAGDCGGSKFPTVNCSGKFIQKSNWRIRRRIVTPFIAASGYAVGKSLYEPDLLDVWELMQKAKDEGREIPVQPMSLPPKSLSDTATMTIKMVDEVADDDMILDIGPETANKFAQMSNKPEQWSGTDRLVCLKSTNSETALKLWQRYCRWWRFSIAGGGDTLAAIDKYNMSDKVSYHFHWWRTFLEFLEGKKLPAVEILEKERRIITINN